jgi:hypothetical protein
VVGSHRLRNRFDTSTVVRAVSVFPFGQFRMRQDHGVTLIQKMRIPSRSRKGGPIRLGPLKTLFSENHSHRLVFTPKGQKT